MKMTLTIADDITIKELDDLHTAILATASFWKEDIVSVDTETSDGGKP